MADVTDYATRRMLVKYGKPDVLYTEFVSADGLASEKGRRALVADLRYEEDERPIVAQIFGANPENIEKAAELVRELGFDGVDINMGCPDKAVIKQGAGSALIKKPPLAREIIRAAKKGAAGMPVSVKTRIGYSKNEIETWLPQILAEKPAALTVHLRTTKEMSQVDAHWDLAPRISELAKEAGVLAIGNGDVKNREQGERKAEQADLDGIMIGRGIFGNPWFFSKEIRISDIPLERRLGAMLEHARIFEKELSGKGVKGYHVMRKHFKAYVSGFAGAGDLRANLMQTEGVGEAERVVNDFLQSSAISNQSLDDK